MNAPAPDPGDIIYLPTDAILYDADDGVVAGFPASVIANAFQSWLDHKAAETTPPHPRYTSARAYLDDREETG